MGREKRRAEPPGAGSFKTAKGKTDGENPGKKAGSDIAYQNKDITSKMFA